MDDTALVIIAVGLFIAWVFVPIAIIHYVLVIVPMRLDEIKDWFLPTQEPDPSGSGLSKPAPAPTRVVSSSPGAIATGAVLAGAQPGTSTTRSGAWYYAQLLKPDRKPKSEEELKDLLENRFWQFHRWSRYTAPLILVIVLSGLMLAFTGLWLASSLNSTVKAKASNSDNANIATGSVGGDKVLNEANATTKNEEPTTLLRRIKSPFVMALLGAFVWSLYEILNRIRSRDLTPSELYDVAFRFTAAVPIGYAFSLLVFDTVPGFMAFAVSAFPFRDLRLLIRKIVLEKQKVEEGPPPAPSPMSKGYTGELVSGLGREALARLQELNIETYYDLAHTDPIRLMVQTGAPIKLVLAWMDLALPAAWFPKQKSILEQLGMPCAIDLWRFYEHYYVQVAAEDEKKWREDPAAIALGRNLDIPIEILSRSLKSLYEDPHVRFLVHVSHCSPPPEAANSVK